MKKHLIFALTVSLLPAIISPAFAKCNVNKSIHAQPMWGTLTTLDGRVFESLYVQQDGVFYSPVPGETKMHKVLYNIPLEGSPVPLRQVPTLYITDHQNPVVIDESISAENTTRGLVYPGTPNPITMGDWIKGGDSKLKIRVCDDGTSKVKMKIKGLLPNSLYGVWQFNQAGGPPGPWGGIPNIFVTDDEGKARMERKLPFNIFEVVDNLVIVYHSDHRIYGGSPSLTKSSGGPDIHFQLQFDIEDVM